MSYRVDAPYPIDLEPDGLVFAPGAVVAKVDLKSDHNRRHVEAGRLVELSAPEKKAPAPKAKTDEEKA